MLDPDFDLLVLQRVYRPTMLETMRVIQAKGIPVVIDLDDDLLAVHPDSPAYRTLSPFWDVLREALRCADLITVSTPALARRYGNGKAVVVPNGIPRAYLEIPTHEARQVPVVGWTGTVDSHIGALEQVGTSVADLCHEGKARFRAIGDPDAVKIIGAGEFVPGAPMQDLSYARLYADLDVAIVPLKPSRFSAGKSWMKGLEAAALGVPFVASPTPEYVRLNEMGAGILAERAKDWKVQIGRLVGSGDLRAEYAANGRAVAATMTTEAFQAPKLWEAWLAADRSRRSQPLYAHSRTG